MNLLDALFIQPGDCVAFVGAGGKTAAMFRLASELQFGGQRVIITTTTRMAQGEMSQIPAAFAVGSPAIFPADLNVKLEQARTLFLYSHTEAGKVVGLSPAEILSLAQHFKSPPTILIEADGSRRLPLKAPYDHEPVVPECANRVLVIAGLSALNHPLTAATVYGADRMVELLGLSAGAPVDENLMASILCDPRMGLKGIPDRAEVVALLNQTDQADPEAASRIADQLLECPRYSGVILASLQTNDPVQEIHRPIAAIVLAAGRSSRMGQPKSLLPWSGSTIIRHICQTLLACPVQEVIVVAGEHQAQIEQALTDLPVRIITNPEYATSEMLSSLKIGIRAVSSRSQASLTVLGDQPFLEVNSVRQILSAYHRHQSPVTAPSFAGRRGHPILMDRSLWDELLALPSESAPRDLLAKHQAEIDYVAMDSDAILRDIDTPADYQQALDETQ
jgi:molybdenum cofactor cytidylyltransferase